MLKEYKNLQILTIDPPFNIQNLPKNHFRTFCMGHFCELYVDRDGNKCPDNYYCYYRHQEMELFIERQTPEVGTKFKALPKSDFGPTFLYLFNLNLTELPDTSVDGYSSVTLIDAESNQLVDLTIANLPENLTYLDIRNNRFKVLRPEVLEFLKKRNNTLRIRLAYNPWICSCECTEFLKFFDKFQKMIDDFDEVKCDDGITPSINLDECRLRVNNRIIIVAIIIVAVCIIACLIVFRFRTAILMWLYYHNIFVDCILRTAENIEFHQKFDAFLAFSHKNLDLIEEYVEQLENGSREFKLCFYHRDWLIGASIPACILQTIDDSNRIILLMTQEFIKSSWGTFEFRTAIKVTSLNRHKRLIVIVYPEVENFHDLDSELRLYLKYNTYLRRDDPQFWKKLIYAMPHKKIRSLKKKAERNGDNGAEV